MTSWFLTDEELGKKDDDHKPSNKPVLRTGAWTPAPRIPPRRIFKRLLLLAAFAVVVYLFIKNIPTDISFRDSRRPQYPNAKQPGSSGGSGDPVKLGPPPTGSGVGDTKGKDGGNKGAIKTSAGDHSGKNKKPDEAEAEEEESGGAVTSGKGSKKPSEPSTKEKPSKKGKSTTAEEEVDPDPFSPDGEEPYNGPLRFLNLSASLYRSTEFRGVPEAAKNVLFAAASLKSAGSILPVACEMAAESRSSVHFALMGRSEIDLEQLREVNGVDGSCPIMFHDARPDYAAISTDERIELAAQRALQHIEIYTHPKVVIIDGSAVEDESFTAGILSQAAKLQKNVIELPRGAAERLPFLAKLDSNALSAWNHISFDILIHASPGTSGSLIRLLKSLSNADYTSVSVPHLTIELAHDIDESTEVYLQQFPWPPVSVPNPMNVRQMSVRRRVITESMNEEASSVRTIESFWPHNGNAHVLVLSPQAELAPGFLQYAKYTLLEYAYSEIATLQQTSKRLFGFSLELPTTGLDGKIFTPPLFTDTVKPKSKSKSKSKSETPTPFLWQAPNSNAMLILGNRWIELHGFVSRILEVQHRTTAAPPALLAQKLVSKRYPSWLEHALRLCRARGYWSIYPSAQTAGALATVHSERYVAPEEYAKDQKPEDREKGNMLLSRAVFETLPEGGQLPLFADLPMLTWDGEETGVAEFNRAAAAYAAKFRTTVGGCKPAGKDEDGAEEFVTPHKSAKDLFCKR